MLSVMSVLLVFYLTWSFSFLHDSDKSHCSASFNLSVIRYPGPSHCISASYTFISHCCYPINNFYMWSAFTVFICFLAIVLWCISFIYRKIVLSSVVNSIPVYVLFQLLCSCCCDSYLNEFSLPGPAICKGS